MKVVLWAILLAALSPSVRAHTFSTPVTSAAYVLATALDMYRMRNGGALPKDWNELEGKYIIRRQLEIKLGGALDEKFPWFGDSKIEMAPPASGRTDSGRILSITGTSLREDRRQMDGRYVIWQHADGHIGMAWLDEPVVARQFEQAGVPLPTGPISIQPPFQNQSLEHLVQDYADKNFKDPKNPSADEIDRLKRDFRDRYKDDDSAPVSHETAHPTQPATPKPMATSPQSAELQASQPRPIWRWLAVVSVIVVSALFIWKLRK